jgi:hypothetical protein
VNKVGETKANDGNKNVQDCPEHRKFAVPCCTKIMENDYDTRCKTTQNLTRPGPPFCVKSHLVPKIKKEMDCFDATPVMDTSKLTKPKISIQTMTTPGLAWLTTLSL